MTSLLDLGVAGSLEGIGCAGEGCPRCDFLGCVLPGGYSLVRSAIGVAQVLAPSVEQQIRRLLGEQELEDEEGRPYLSSDALGPLADQLASLEEVLGQRVDREDLLPSDVAPVLNASAPGVLTLADDGQQRSALLLRMRLTAAVRYLEQAARADTNLWIVI